ncbi:MAG: methyltetrahydrofolate cobalamin methyltransferase [Desulfocucumaceae bacterium]
MLIVGELINTSRKEMGQAVEEKNIDLIKSIAVAQVQAGASYIDINCGTQMEDEPQIIKWLVQNVQEVIKEPICIDTPDPEVMESGLSVIKNGQPMINSISAEKEKFESILPLVLKYGAKVIALCIDDEGIPKTSDDRVKIVRRLVKDLTCAGVREEDIYIDPLVKPLSTGDQAGLEVLETIGFIKNEYPKVHTICGLSNISFGLPKRKVLNQVFLTHTMAYGMDSYILNPLDNDMMGFLYASRALMGGDPYCGQYLAAFRKGIYN